MASYNTLVLTLITSSLLIAGCGGGGGGVEPRRPETLVYLNADRTQLMAAPDDQSLMPKLLSGTPFTEISHFVVSPDGEYVAYIADQDVNGQMDLYVAEIDGVAPLKLTRFNHDYADVADMKWSPDSSRLAFRADDTGFDGRMILYSVNVDGSRLLETAYMDNYMSSVFVDDQYQWSPDGNYLAWVLDEPTYRQFSLWSLDMRGGAQATAGNSVHMVGNALNEEITSFKWSPNSQRIAFRTDDFTSDNQYVIAAVPADGSGPAFMATGAPGSTAMVNDYTWSPDSRLLAQAIYNVSAPSVGIGINTFDVDTLNSVRVVTTSSFGDLQWAHNSNTLAFAAGYDLSLGQASGEIRLLAYDAGTQTLNDLTHNLETDEYLDLSGYLWSPDDSRILYLSRQYADTRVHVADTSGTTEPSRLTILANHIIDGLNWSPDGAYIGLLALQNGVAFHPGHWYLFDKLGQPVWTSETLYTYDSSHRMKWAKDMKRAVYTGSATTYGLDRLYSIQLSDLATITVANEVWRTPVFEYAEESLQEE